MWFSAVDQLLPKVLHSLYALVEAQRQQVVACAHSICRSSGLRKTAIAFENSLGEGMRSS